ncbi:MAG: OmpA family protein, partial [Plesiomonas sp.]
DSTGAETYNQALSELRAQAVANQLVDLGVTQGQLEWRGEGESSPTANNTTAEGRAKNRRVEVTIPHFQFEGQAE